jgi:hypothetical protein
VGVSSRLGVAPLEIVDDMASGVHSRGLEALNRRVAALPPAPPAPAPAPIVDDIVKPKSFSNIFLASDAFLFISRIAPKLSSTARLMAGRPRQVVSEVRSDPIVVGVAIVLGLAAFTPKEGLYDDDGPTTLVEEMGTGDAVTLLLRGEQDLSTTSTSLAMNGWSSSSLDEARFSLFLTKQRPRKSTNSADQSSGCFS